MDVEDTPAKDKDNDKAARDSDWAMGEEEKEDD